MLDGRGRLDSDLLSRLGLGPSLVSGGSGVSVPICEGRALTARVEIATTHQAGAIAAYGSAVLGAFREVEDAFANERLIADRLPFAEAALTDRTEAVRIARVQYQAGRRDLLWVSRITAEQIAAQADEIRVRSLQRSNRINLYLALGGGIEPEPMER